MNTYIINYNNNIFIVTANSYLEAEDKFLERAGGDNVGVYDIASFPESEIKNLGPEVIFI